MGEVKLISECYIRPQNEVNKSKEKYYLNSSELNLLLLHYGKCGYLYKKPQDFNPLIFFEKLKHSLSIVLVHFYPLGGQLVTESYEDDHSSRIYVDFSKGRGVKVIHAIAPDLKLDDIMSLNNDIPLMLQSFFNFGDNLINYDGHSNSLFIVQVTELKDGIFFGTSVNHCLVDGTSDIHFLNMWSEIFMSSSSSSSSSSISRVPIFRDSYLNTMLQTNNKLPYINPNEFVIRIPNNHLRERIFHFPNKIIAMLKAKANSEAFNLRNKISTVQAVTAFIWKSISRARNLQSDDVTNCLMVANLRARLSPLLSNESFGCLLTTPTGTANVGDLIANNLGWAASLLHKEVMGVDQELARKIFCESPDVVLPGFGSAGPNPLFIAGSPMLGFYSEKFGLGKPLGVRMGYENEEGLVTIYPGAELDGSVDVQVSLAPATMSALLLDQEFMSLTSQLQSKM